MMNFESFSQLVDAIMQQGYPEDDAARFARIIGDTPVEDPENGQWLVIENDEVIARIDPI